MGDAGGKSADLAQRSVDRINRIMALRIVFIAPFGLKQKTTVWARTLPIAQELVARGHHATILVPPWDSPEDAGKEETNGGVHIKQVSLRGGLLGTVRTLLQAIHDLEPNIIHIVKPRAHAGLVQWWLWQRRHKLTAKIVLDVDDWEQAWNPINRYPWHVGQFLAWQEEWGIRHAHGITAASRWLESKIGTVAPHIPTLYLPNGVTPITPSQVRESEQSPQAPQILFFSRFVEVTPEWLVAFWKAIQSQLPTAELIIAGTPVQPWLSEPFHAALAHSSGVHWRGFVPPHELQALYANATCAIFPALPVPLQQAKCSVRLATTLLHGVPVIASAVGEQANYGADGAAHLVPSDATPQEFAQQVILAIRNNPNTTQARSQVTENLLARYAWSRLVSPLVSFYETLLHQAV